MAHFKKGALRGAERRALKAAKGRSAARQATKKAPKVHQFESHWGEDLPEPVQGIARVLSRGLPE
jgi:hypothetical protein